MGDKQLERAAYANLFFKTTQDTSITATPLKLTVKKQQENC
ncbi:hypothetical protein [Nonlabens sp.]